MQGLELFLFFTEKFSSLGIKHIVTGSVATILYGEPRLTHDIDIVIWIDDLDVEKFSAAFPLEEFYCPPAEVLKVESHRTQRGHFNLIHHETGFKADVYFASKTPFYSWAFDKAQNISLGENRNISVAPPEYVLVNKLSFYREGGSEKHLADIRGMINAGQEFDWSVVESEIEKRGLVDELSLVRPKVE